MNFFSTIEKFQRYLLTRLDLCKTDNNNQTLLELRSRSVNEQNKLQYIGGENDANESDVTTATEKSLDYDEANLRGEELQ